MARLRRRIACPALTLLLVLLAGAAAALTSAGCGGSAEQRPLAPVHGQVFYRGKPLAGGSIVFSPDPHRGGGNAPLAWATLDQEGRFQLTSTGSRRGAVLGWHRITVAAAGLPSRYCDPELSGQSYEVRPGRLNSCHLHLD